MQWLKDRVGSGSSHEGAEKQNFMIGSHQWTGSAQSKSKKSNDSPAPSPSAAPMAPKGSFRNPEAADRAVQTFDAQQKPNPYLQMSSSKKMSEEKKSKSGIYPKIFESSEQRGARGAAADAKDAKNSGSGSDEEEEEVLTGAQVLVTIPGAIVHLIDEDESVHLATGDFSLVSLIQEETKVAVIAKVGTELQWPLVQEEPAVKLDPTHYFFTLTVPKHINDNDSTSSRGERNSGPDTLNYGVTFPAGSGGEEHLAKIQELDYFLGRYTLFSAPTIVQGEDIKDSGKQAEALETLSPRDANFPGTVVPEETVSGEGKVVPSEENSKAFWTTVAPNVDDYNHKMAKGIAIGAGQLIRGIFWLSDSTVERLDSGHSYMRNRFKPKDKKSNISPVVLKSVRTARKLSSMTDKVTAGVLGGLVYTTGLFSAAVVQSTPGKVFFKLLPGEVALVSLDAFSRVFDAVEKAGTEVMTQSSSVTQEFVNYRYGEQAKEFTDEYLRTVGHVASTAWTVTKIRRALNPNKGKLSKTSIAKSLAKSAVQSAK